MHETALGAPADWWLGNAPRTARIAEVRVPPSQQDGDHWNWNSTYWRKLGAPWGGLLTTPADLARYARMILGGGCLEGVRVLSSSTVDAATSNQTTHLRDLPDADRRCKPWGLGWRLNWTSHSDTFGDLVPPEAVGHWGATGTLLWIDRRNDRFTAILSTQPTELGGRRLVRLSNAAAAAFQPVV
jgi:CubicO group peptidase (beta-lactamase class C family)